MIGPIVGAIVSSPHTPCDFCGLLCDEWEGAVEALGEIFCVSCAEFLEIDFEYDDEEEDVAS
jgi:hypothetical protein